MLASGRGLEQSQHPARLPLLPLTLCKRFSHPSLSGYGEASGRPKHADFFSRGQREVRLPGVKEKQRFVRSHEPRDAFGTRTLVSV